MFFNDTGWKKRGRRIGELRVKGTREFRLGRADWGMRCSICRSENISAGAVIAKSVKSSLDKGKHDKKDDEEKKLTFDPKYMCE